MKKRTPLQSGEKVESYLSVPFKEPPWARQLLHEAGIMADGPMVAPPLPPPGSGGPDVDDGLLDDPETTDPSYSVVPDFVFDIETALRPNEDIRKAIRSMFRGIRLGATDGPFVDVRQTIIATLAPVSASDYTPPERRCLRIGAWWSSRWLDQDQPENDYPLPPELKVGPDLVAARERGLALVLPLASTVPNARAGDLKIFGVFINASFVRRVFQSKLSLPTL